MSDVVETLIDKNSSKPSNNAQEQEVNNCTEFLKIEYQKYRKYKNLIRAIEECIDDKNDNLLDEHLKNKINNIILEKSVSQLKLGNGLNEETLETVLGTPLDNVELTYSDGNKLLTCLKLPNRSSISNINHFTLLCKDRIEVGTNTNKSPLDFSQEDSTLFELKNKFDQEQEIYLKNLKELIVVLEKMKDTRLETVPTKTDKKIEECTLKSDINYLKSRLAKDKCRIDIFMEKSHSLRAYTEIIKDIKEQRQELQIEIERLRDLKKKYNDISCKEYNDILRSYLQYRSAYEKRKMMYELYK